MSQDTNDKELLVLAAKAAGCDVVWKRGMHQGDPHEGLFDRATGYPTTWNPIHDDGDALRLAVKLGMLFTYMHDRFEMFQLYYWQELNNDLQPSEATRRAIVRVAEAIGKEMP